MPKACRILVHEDPPSRAEVPAAEPGPRARLKAQLKGLSGNPIVSALLEATDLSMVLLDGQRQILVGNSALLSRLGLDRVDALQGLRLGEVLGCTEALDCPGGCGTGARCRVCGAVLAIARSQATGLPVEQDCLLNVRRGDAVDAVELHVKATQLVVEGERCTVLALRDISAEKRRRLLERVFLHDLANTVSPLVLNAQVLENEATGDAARRARKVAQLAQRVQSEIEDHRVLTQAEAGALKVNRAPVDPEAILDEAAGLLHTDAVAQDRTIAVDRGRAARPLTTDRSLLLRVLVNMIKNALEATPAGGRVKAWAVETSDGCEFRVWNAGAMPPEVALRIFKRSFSTKAGSGRGIGTFSMKLYGERYLGGTVGFSTNADGTTFFIRLTG